MNSSMTTLDAILPQCRFLVGPTAAGKTSLAIDLAQRLSAEIVALDSMTVYRRMDIGTAKPTLDEQRQAPHHLIDLIDTDVEFSVTDYLLAANNVCQEILSRGRIPLFVGGSGLYLRSLLRGVCDAVPANWEFRQQWAERYQAEGAVSVHNELQKVDPLAAQRLHPQDQRRIIRALEVYHFTGTPLSAQQQQPVRPLEQRPRHLYWLDWPRETLYARINARVLQMIDDGLIDEVRSLIANPPTIGRTARQGLGYKEVIEWLEAGQSSTLATLIELIQTRTRQFAKRQVTWFRNLAEVELIPVSNPQKLPSELLDRFQQEFPSKTSPH